MENNGSPSMNIDSTGALFTVTLSILISDCEFKEDVSDVNVH